MQIESDLVLDAKAMLVVLKAQLGLLEKQIRMLSQLLEGSPGIDRDAGFGDRRQEADFVVVDQLRLRELVEQMGEQVKLITAGVAAVSDGRV